MKKNNQAVLILVLFGIITEANAGCTSMSTCSGTTCGGSSRFNYGSSFGYGGSTYYCCCSNGAFCTTSSTETQCPTPTAASPPSPSPPPPSPPPPSTSSTTENFNMSYGDMYALSSIYGDGCQTFSACDKDCMAAYDVISTDFTGSSGYLTLEAAVNPNPDSCTCDTKHYEGAITHASSSSVGSNELLDTTTDAGMNVRLRSYGDSISVVFWPNTYSYYSSSHGCELYYSKTDPYWYSFNMNTGDELTFSYKSETCPVTSWCETSCAQGYTVSVLTSTDYKFTSSYAGTDCVCDVLYFSGKSTGRGIYVGSGLELYMQYSDIKLHSPHDDCSISYYQKYVYGASSKLKMLRVTYGIISALAFLI